jgi:hypothetical protein
MSIERLQAERDITRLVYDYGAAVDGRDFDGIAACYWPDAWEDHAPDYCGPVGGYVDWLRQIMPPGPVLTHQFGNVKVDVADGGESARVDSSCLSTATFPSSEGGPIGWQQAGLRYIDEVGCRQGEWRFQRRSCRHLWKIEDGVAQAVAPTG